ncbi:hypothetical protein NKH55_28700 [Mesorhizobium opportunistum]|uniref:hypothetical protein n=1 Tax=Mesorhizobium opportunistum TaxID=593909 RepID=UPI00333C6547
MAQPLEQTGFDIFSSHEQILSKTRVDVHRSIDRCDAKTPNSALKPAKIRDQGIFLWNPKGFRKRRHHLSDTLSVATLAICNVSVY